MLSGPCGWNDVVPKDVARQPHYENRGIQPDAYMRANLTPDELRGAYRYNVNKYLARYREKNGVEDLRKAEVYLKWLIELEVNNG